MWCSPRVCDVGSAGTHTLLHKCRVNEVKRHLADYETIVHLHWIIIVLAFAPCMPLCPSDINISWPTLLTFDLIKVFMRLPTPTYVGSIGLKCRPREDWKDVFLKETRWGLTTYSSFSLMIYISRRWTNPAPVPCIRSQYDAVHLMPSRPPSLTFLALRGNDTGPIQHRSAIDSCRTRYRPLFRI